MHCKANSWRVCEQQTFSRTYLNKRQIAQTLLLLLSNFPGDEQYKIA